MIRLPLIGASTVMILASPAFGQLAHFRSHVARFNPSGYSSRFVPALANGHIGPYAGLRPSTWAVPARYNAYPWNGHTFYADRSGAFSSLGFYGGYGYLGGYFGPRYVYGSGIPVGLDSAYFEYAGNWPYLSAGYNPWYPSNTLYSIELPVMEYSQPYVSPRAASSAPFDHAIIELTVPADATVTVQGVLTKQSGETRTFISPPLEPGRDYDYTIKAQWKEGDKSVDQSKTVTVRPGERSAVMFLSQAGA